jgi:D-tyrosyl-tRNA(Tyr) deacylase
VRALVQRVRTARVVVRGEPVAAIGPGILLLLGVRRDDGEREAECLASKCAALRIFPDSGGKMNLSLSDRDGEALVVPQFTLYADVSRGRRPSFEDAAAPAEAERLYGRFVELLRAAGIRVATGVFREHMEVELVNDGPVTLWVDTAELPA